MSDLLPNLESLIDKLSGDTLAVRDARALAEAVRGANADGRLDAALAAVVAAWRQS